MKKISSWHLSNLLRLKWQFALSAFFGITISLMTFIPSLEENFARLGDKSLFISLLLGLASILALVGSINFGFLLHYIQSVSDEKYQMYLRFKDEVRNLKLFLDKIYENGLIDIEYDYHLGLLRDITLKDFPITHFNERIDPLIEYIKDQEEYLDEEGDFGVLLRGVAYSVNNLEEMIEELFKNFVKQILIKRIVNSVVKAFITLAIVVIMILFFSLFFDFLISAVAWGVGIALGFMTFMLLIEIAMIVIRESKEYYEFESPNDQPLE